MAIKESDAIYNQRSGLCQRKQCPCGSKPSDVKKLLKVSNIVISLHAANPRELTAIDGVSR